MTYGDKLFPKTNLHNPIVYKEENSSYKDENSSYKKENTSQKEGEKIKKGISEKEIKGKIVFLILTIFQRTGRPPESRSEFQQLCYLQ